MNAAVPFTAPAGRTALCTVLNDAFVPGFAVLAHTLRRQHPGIDLPFHIFHHPELAPLAPESRERIASWYPGACFHEVDASLYQTVWDNRDGRLRTPHRLKSAFFVIEAFSLRDFDRVVALDSDMIVTGDLSPLFHHPAAFAATRAIDYDAGEILDFFNTGVLVIGKPNLTGDTYRRLLDHRISDEYDTRKGKADQAIFNDFFGPEGYTELDEAFNVTKRKFPDDSFGRVEDLLDERVRILHFVADKPWDQHLDPSQARYTKLEAHWARLLKDAMSYDQLFGHLRLVHSSAEKRARDIQHERRDLAKVTVTAEKAKVTAEKAKLSAEKERTFRKRERLARINELRNLTHKTGLAVENLLEQTEMLTRPPEGARGLKRWFSTLLRSINRQRILAATTRCRDSWNKHANRMEEKIASLEPTDDEPKP